MNLDNNKQDIADRMQKYSSDIDADQIWMSIEDQVLADNEAYHRRRKRRLFFIPFLIGLGVLLMLTINSEHEPQDSISLGSAIVMETTVDEEENSSIENEELSVPSPEATAAELETHTNLATQSVKNQIIHVEQDLDDQDRPEYSLRSEKTNDSSSSALRTNWASEIGTSSLVIRSEIQNNGSQASSENTIGARKSSPFLTLEQSEGERKTTIHALAKKQSYVKDESTVDVSRRITTIIPIGLNKASTIETTVSLVSGLSAMTRSIEPLTVEAEEWSKAREETEQELTSSHFGINFSVRHESGFSFTSGLNSRVIHSRFKYQDAVSDTTLVRGLRIRYYDLNLDTVSVYEMIPKVTTTTTDYSVINRYHTYEIPLVVGYTQSINRLSLGVHAGISLQYLHTVSGTIRAQSGGVNDLTSELYKPTSGVGYRAGIALGYDLTRILSFGIQGYYQTTPNLVASSSGLQDVYQLYGGQFSVGIKL